MVNRGKSRTLAKRGQTKKNRATKNAGNLKRGQAKSSISRRKSIVVKQHSSRRGRGKVSGIHHKVLRYVSLRCFISWLKDLQNRKTRDIKKLILDFNLIQAFFAVVFVWLFALLHIGTIRDYQNKFLEALGKANFTYVQISKDTLETDIKPSIWVYSLSNSPDLQEIVVVDSTGNFNPFYWDDRFYKGHVKHINGVCFSKNKVIVKFGKIKKEFSYSLFLAGLGLREYKGDKSQVIQDIDGLITIKNMIALLVLLTPGIFGVAYIISMFIHAIFSFVTGLFVALVNSVDHHLDKGIKVASGLYVPLVLIMDLIFITHFLYHKSQVGLLAGIYIVLFVLGVLAIKLEVACDKHEVFYFFSFCKKLFKKLRLK